MTKASTDRLDRAIAAAMDATHEPGDVSLLHRQYARALIADLLEGLEKPEGANLWWDEETGWDACLAAFRQRAGIEEEG